MTSEPCHELSEEPRILHRTDPHTQPDLFETVYVVTEAQRNLVRQELARNPARIAVDTETTGLCIDRDQVIGVCLSFPPWTRGYYIPYYGSPDRAYSPAYTTAEEWQQAHQVIVEVLTSPYEKIFHNALFDVPIVYWSVGVAVQNVAHDTMIMSHTINPDHQHGLKDLAVRHIHVDADAYEAALNRLAGRSNAAKQSYWKIAPEDVARYGVGDACFTGRLHDIFSNLFRQPEYRYRRDVYEHIAMPLLRELIGVRVYGIPVNEEFLARGKAWYEARLQYLREQIRDNVNDPQFNPASFQQVNDLLFNKLGMQFPGLRKTQTGYATDEETLNTLRGKHPIIELLLEYRATQKLLSTYFVGLLEQCGPDGRFRPDIAQIGTRTGRLSMSRIHQIPRTTPLDSCFAWLAAEPKHESAPLVRMAFAAPDGYVIVGGDYSQLEARVLAHFSQDRELCRIYRQAEDIHSATAKTMFNLPVDISDVATRFPEHRQRAKTINFALLYMESVAGLARQLQVPYRTAQEYYDQFFRIYCDIPPWAAREIKQANSRGYIETLFGRIRERQSSDEEFRQWKATAPPPRRPRVVPACYAKTRYRGGIGLSVEFDLALSLHEWTPDTANRLRDTIRRVRSQCANCPVLHPCYYTLEYKRLEKQFTHHDRQLLNTKIQGSAADLVNLGIVRMGELIERHDCDAQLIIYVHDEVHYLVPTSINIDQFVADFSATMQSVGEYISVPLVFEPRVGKNWGEIK